MPAVKRLATKIRIGVSADQAAWVKRQASMRLLSEAAVIRELIAAAMSADRGKDSRTQESAA